MANGAVPARCIAATAVVAPESVNLDDNVFHCFDARCGKEGDVIDLWAALHQLDLRTAALDLVQTFGLEPAPTKRTEKRNG